jgi:glycosyltransferase involved in cell wall biosynthesis
VTHYGIFLGWQPGVELRGEGVGRYIAALLKAGEADRSIRFTVVCPSWHRKTITDLCKSEGVPATAFDFWTPGAEPAFLRLVNWLEGRGPVRKRRKRRRFGLYVGFKRFVTRAARWSASSIMGARSLPALGLVLLLLLALAVLAAPVVALGLVLLGVRQLLVWVGARRLLDRLAYRNYSLRGLLRAGVGLLGERKRQAVRWLYGLMLDREHELLVARANSLDHVRAWYAPAAFWPSFNKIDKPRVMCVPDVVTAQFAVPFAALGNEGGVEEFRRLERAIRGSDRLVTYSDTIKWTVLVDRYGIPPRQIDVIPHGANRLNAFIELQGFSNPAAARSHCESLVNRAIHRNAINFVSQRFTIEGIRYILFPSQFRPSKNVLSLLTAFEHLLRNRQAGIKLVLTGDPSDIPQIEAFVREKNLAMDVLFLKRVSTEELAALYSCATLAVNPSLAEGGCPFTLTEALSVGTPVVMGRMSVTEEVIRDPAMQELTLFDPYDWRALADKIGWALDNRDMLLRAQLAYFEDTLSKRSWSHVVEDYKALFERIAQAGPNGPS